MRKLISKLHERRARFHSRLLKSAFERSGVYNRLYLLEFYLKKEAELVCAIVDDLKSL